MADAVARWKAPGDILDYTPSGNLSQGDVVVIGERIFVAAQDILADEKGALHVTGLFKFPKATGGGTDIAQWADVFWDVADGNIQDDADSGTNKSAGVCVEAAGTTQDWVLVRLPCEIT